MHRTFQLVIWLRRLVTLEDGQDLVEYALLVALVALGATASMKSLATGIGAAFTRISTQLSSSIT
jgi:pilus assembly protein Flp/PilA